MLYNSNDLTDGALYEPSEPSDIGMVIDLLNPQPGEQIVDLGSGDGRIVVAIARYGAFAHGVEKNEFLVDVARKKIRYSGLQNAFIHHVNFWDLNLSGFQKVFIYQYHTVMERLGKKLQEELKPGSQIVSHHWSFPHWQPVKQLQDIYLYTL